MPCYDPRDNPRDLLSSYKDDKNKLEARLCGVIKRLQLKCDNETQFKSELNVASIEAGVDVLEWWREHKNKDNDKS